MQAKADAAAELVEPQPAAPSAQALSEAMAEFESLARAAQAAPVQSVPVQSAAAPASVPVSDESVSVASAPFDARDASPQTATDIESLLAAAPAPAAQAASQPAPFQWGQPAQSVPPALVEPAPAASAFEAARPVEQEPRKAQWPFGVTSPIGSEPAPAASADNLFAEAPASAAQPLSVPQAPEQHRQQPAAPQQTAQQPAAVAASDPFDFLGTSTTSAPISATPFVVPDTTIAGFAASTTGGSDPLTPEFVEPPATSSYEPPAGHWSRQADLDDETQPFENTLSREVGGGNVATTTSALILPSIPQHADFSTPLGGTGEVLVTGTIDLPQSFGTMGGDSRRYDDPDVDHLYDASDNEVVSTESAPVRATRAVSTHTSTHGVIQANKPGNNRMLTVLLITASVLAVGVVALLVAGLILK